MKSLCALRTEMKSRELDVRNVSNKFNTSREPFEGRGEGSTKANSGF